MKVMIAITLAVCVVSRAHAQDRARVLQGVWDAELSVAPAARAELIVQRTGLGWQAALNGKHRTTFRAAGIQVDFDLGRDVGRFRGRFTPDSSVIRGLWMQPDTARGYISLPTALRRRGSMWTAHVSPAAARIAIELVVHERADTVWAFIRNAESNPATLPGFTVSMSGDSVRLINSRDSSDVIRGRYDASRKIIVMRIPELTDGEIEFTRRGGR
jgi:hypothetical protein